VLRDRGQWNYWLCLALELLWAAYFGIAVTVEWYKQFGIGLTQIAALQVVMGVFTILFDIPCGWLADRIGVRLVMLMGISMQVVQSALFGLWCTHFWQFCIMLAITGVAWSFTSGTAKAMVKSTVPERVGDYPKRSVQSRALGQLIGIAIGSILLARFDVKAPFIFQPLAFVAALVIGLMLKSSSTIKQRVTHPMLKSVIKIGRSMFIERPDVRWVVLLSATANASVLAMSWLVQPDLRNAGVHVNLFGIVFAVRTVATFVLAYFKDWFVRRFGDHGAQAMIIAFVVLCALFAGLPTSWSGAIAVFVACAVVTAFSEAIMTDTVNKRMPELEDHATTVYSISTAAQAALFVVSPLMGWVNDTVSTNVAYFCVAGVTALFGGFCLQRYKHALRGVQR
jgi:MFS family permease